MKRGFKISDLISPVKRARVDVLRTDMNPEKKKRVIEEWKDKVKQSWTGKKRPQQTSLNANLPTEQFDGPHWKCLSAGELSPGQYTAYHFGAMFELRELHKASHPEDVLRKLFRMSLNHTLFGAAQKKVKPDYYIFALSSPVLDWDIRMNFHEMDDNTIESILIQFELVDQSNRRKDEGRDSMTTAPINLDITAVQRMWPKRSRKHRGGTRKPRPITYNINNKALIPVDNDDYYCLFRACELARANACMNASQFYKYKNSDSKQRKNIMRIIHEMDIEEFLSGYAIEDYGPLIQQYYEQHWPSKFKLFCFQNNGNFKPIWASEVEQYEMPISIYFHDEEEHFDAIRNVGHLFGKKDDDSARGKYCFKCEQPYLRDIDHSSKCKAKCLSCQRVGNGFPCEKEPGFKQFCFACTKVFNNPDCWAHHCEENLCVRSKRCHECRVVYKPKNVKNFGGHKCGQTHCKNCRIYHGKRPCFITEQKIKNKEYRYVCHDFESRTNYKPDPTRMRFQHKVNFITAYVYCTRCLDNGTWDKPLEEPCEICGPHRSYAFTPFDFEELEKFDKIYKHESPLRAFTQWLLYFEQDQAELNMENEENPIGFLLGDMDKENEDPSINGDDPQQQKEPKKKRFETLAYAHCGSRYDNVMIFGEIFRMGGLRPKVIRQGNKLYEMKVQKPGHITTTIFRDSYNIIPRSLAGFVPTFGLKIEEKKYFPHKYNVEENYYTKLDHLPDIEYYNPSSMFPADREKFMAWYAANYNQPFALNEVIADYCHNDTQILAHGLVSMRHLYKKITGQDITHSVTIASACMRFFKALHNAKKGHKRIDLALTPHLGYEKRDKQSNLARKFLKYYAAKNNVHVQHVENGGEFTFLNYKLDGYVKRAPPLRDLCIEVQGCFYHACRKCYPNDNQPLFEGKSAGFIREATAERIRAIKEEMEVEEFYECEINDMLEKSRKALRRKQQQQAAAEEEEASNHEDADAGSTINEADEEVGSNGDPADDLNMAEFFDNCKVSGPIELPEAFFGGRTGPMMMFASTLDRPEKVIRYRDVNSLYPYTNYHVEYPFTHPELRIYDKAVNWESPDDIVDETGHPIAGIIKCDVLPPRHVGLGIPVLPMRVKGRLHFSLCRSCSLQYGTEGKRYHEYSCPHYEDKDREFVCTIPHIELEAALKTGYKVTHLHRAYEWRCGADWTKRLFYEYIQTFMKVKYEASGWPADCTDAASKKKFMEEVYYECGVQLDEEHMIKNNGLRYIAKLCLNSLWGRFALRNRLSQTVIADNSDELSKYLNDPTIVINDIEQLNEEAWMLMFKFKDEHVVENSSSNQILALWTTSAARLHLLQGIYRIEDRHDGNVLYMDTDSIIYEYDADKEDPMQPVSGDQLGQWKDEYPDHWIREYVSGGAKAYALHLEHKETKEVTYTMRCRGITLDCRTSEQLTYQRFKERCLKFGEEDNFELLSYPDKNFRVDRRGEIFSVPLIKKYQPVISKGNVNNVHAVRPFGYSHIPLCARDNPYPCNCKDESTWIRK